MLQVIRKNIEKETITLEFSLEEIRQLNEICFARWCTEPIGSIVAEHARIFGGEFSKLAHIMSQQIIK